MTSNRSETRLGAIRRAWPCLILAGLVAWHAPAPSSAIELSGQPPEGRWTTFARGDDILDILVTDDALWAGTRAGGLVRWRLDGEQVLGVEQFLRPQDPIPGNTVYKLAVDARGQIWMATDAGLAVLDDGGTEDRADDRWQSWSVERSFGGLPSDDLRALAIDGDTVWVGGVQKRDPVSGDWSGGGVGRLYTGGTLDESDDNWAPVMRFADSYREQPDGSVTLGLVSDSINDMVLAPDGSIWVATAPHWRKQRGADPDAPPSWQLVHGGLSRLDTRGTVDPEDDRWTGTSCETTQLTVTCNVQALAIDPGGRAWAAIGGRGVIHFDPKLNIIPPPTTGIRYAPPPGEGDPFVLDIAFGEGDQANTVWMATRGAGLMVLNHRGSISSPNDDIWNFGQLAPFDRQAGLGSDRVQALAFAQDRVWLGTGPERGQAAGLQALGLSKLEIGPPLRTPGGPASNFITDIALGQAGSIWADQAWIATGSRSPAIAMRHSGAGISRLDPQGSRETADDVWTHYDSRGTDDDGRTPWTGLGGDNVQALALDGDALWAASMSGVWNREDARYVDGGLAVFDGSRWTQRSPDPNGGLTTGNLSSLSLACDGSLWVGSGDPWDHDGRGVFVLGAGRSLHAPESDVWSRFAFPELSSDNVTGLAKDCETGRMWVAGTHHMRRSGAGAPWVGGGAAERLTSTGQWTRHTVANGLESYEDGAITAEIKSLATGQGGKVWLGAYGTESTTAGRLISERPFWTAVLNSRGQDAWAHEIFERGGWISAIAEASNGDLWVGSSRGGAARESDAPESWDGPGTEPGLFLKRAGVWTGLDGPGAGLPAGDISVIRIAESGEVWIGTEGWGLARFEPGGPRPTATGTSPARSPTPTPLRSATPTVEVTPTGATPTRKTPTPGPVEIALPWLVQRR
jgi:hypothetical protein